MENSENEKTESEKKSPKDKFKKAFATRHIIGIVAGGIAGFFFYFFMGCTSGTCALKSNPYYYILLGVLLGYLIADLFKKKSQS
jgi:hypothetical protein